MITELEERMDCETGETAIHCWCGGKMHPETGHAVDEFSIYEWLWWRCNRNAMHVSHALPLPLPNVSERETAAIPAVS